MTPLWLDGERACEQLANLVGHAVELAPTTAGCWLVVPRDRALLRLPFWLVVRERAAVDSWRTPEAAMVGFAAGARGWAQAATAAPAGGLDLALMSRLAGGPIAAAAIQADFAAAGISRDRLQRAASRVGVLRTKTGYRGGWSWALPTSDLQSLD